METTENSEESTELTDADNTGTTVIDSETDMDNMDIDSVLAGTTTAAPDTLTTITGGTDLPGASGCGAVIPAITSVFLPISLAALLMWRKKRDDRDE